MSSLNENSNSEERTLPQYSETSSLAPSYKTNESTGLPPKKELSQKEELAMLEEFRKEQEAGKDFEDWHLGVGAPGTRLGGEPGVSKATHSGNIIHRVGEMMESSKSKVEEKIKHQK
jgi:hypothetical protein